ncbi:MAG: hypothetical protein FJ255_04525 [Phycisphaerae bacterium]|nr:hypothetical protein [Phycisphaerae bacterium]
MSILGPSLAQSLAGSAQAERAAVQEKVKLGRQDPRRARGPDQLDLEAEGVETPEAIRSAKGNDQEEGREDRRQHAAYQPGPQTPSPATGANVDVEG